MLLRKMKSRRNKEGKFLGLAGTASGASGIISLHNVCHTVCLGVVAALSIFGIAVSSTALMFLQDYNLLFWSMGVFFLVLSLTLYAKLGKCISQRLIVFNAGLVLAGTPFLPALQIAFWAAGFSIAVLVSLIYIKDKTGVRI